jgi:hypothetical protein
MISKNAGEYFKVAIAAATLAAAYCAWHFGRLTQHGAVAACWAAWAVLALWNKRAVFKALHRLRFKESVAAVSRARAKPTMVDVQLTFGCAFLMVFYFMSM